MQPPLSQANPGGCFIGFNAAIDRKAAEQLVMFVAQAVQGGFGQVTLLLNSPGGLLDHAHYACNVLRAFPVKLATYNVGVIASCANLLFLCGERRLSVPDGTFYFHQTHYPPPPDQVTAAFVKTRAAAIAREDARSAQWVAKRTAQTTKDVLRWMKNERTLDTDAALSNGVIHGIEAPVIPPHSLFLQIVV